MKRKKQFVSDKQEWLFDVSSFELSEPPVSPIHKPIWTENKARLIERYLNLFVFITKHGSYIDAFAGPQEVDKPEMWSAKLVMESEPRRLRHFYLFEKDKEKVKRLRELKRSLPQICQGGGSREVRIYSGDSNTGIQELLQTGCIKPKEATFCLLDQRTFECQWATIEALAKYKSSGYKIELFYFLANAWLDRALAAQKDTEVLDKWWGRGDWKLLRSMNAYGRAAVFVDRFKEEFRYKSVKQWPIFEKANGGGNIMYFMIHATDHYKIAPDLMSRAYEQAVFRGKGYDQISLFE
ncbi:MAG: three-Cys-motif partner protein TcmP [Acidobacteria bacterium]|nr:three-Cys-motif partner protein TcmP [Acidobacteriota bacterium]